ncbi:hypothetical protein GPECTOR_282g748 [Gonium pectorale]|uniref:Uncharacterized protein n=1 Tax=Gonium pectorale TaxID=33097 RepID=A0A150FXM9_GONPE|nr:hypothetical protein GPECTOR_282g748 [Gonium pectorale]|eukprot:KXZ41790.1 hypothetical protein GPECTOR_282g748 [Gonium pectorale]
MGMSAGGGEEAGHDADGAGVAPPADGPGRPSGMSPPPSPKRRRTSSGPTSPGGAPPSPPLPSLPGAGAGPPGQQRQRPGGGRQGDAGLTSDAADLAQTGEQAALASAGDGTLERSELATGTEVAAATAPALRETGLSQQSGRAASARDRNGDLAAADAVVAGGGEAARTGDGELGGEQLDSFDFVQPSNQWQGAEQLQQGELRQYQPRGRELGGAAGHAGEQHAEPPPQTDDAGAGPGTQAQGQGWSPGGERRPPAGAGAGAATGASEADASGGDGGGNGGDGDGGARVSAAAGEDGFPVSPTAERQLSCRAADHQTGSGDGDGGGGGDPGFGAPGGTDDTGDAGSNQGAASRFPAAGVGMAPRLWAGNAPGLQVPLDADGGDGGEWPQGDAEGGQGAGVGGGEEGDGEGGDGAADEADTGGGADMDAEWRGGGVFGGRAAAADGGGAASRGGGCGGGRARKRQRSALEGLFSAFGDSDEGEEDEDGEEGSGVCSL